MEGRLYLEFMFDDMMRIKTWHFSIRQHRELIPRSILAMHVSCAQNLSHKAEGRQREGWNEVCHYPPVALDRGLKFIHLKNGFLYSSPSSLGCHEAKMIGQVSRCNPGTSILTFLLL